MTEPGVLLMKVDSLTCRVALNPVHLETLQLKLTGLQGTHVLCFLKLLA